MKTLDINKMEQINGGDIDICGVKLSASMVAKTAMMSMAFGWVGIGFTVAGAAAYAACRYM